MLYRRIPFPEDSHAAGMMLRGLFHPGSPAASSQCGIFFMRWTNKDMSHESAAKTRLQRLVCCPRTGSEDRLCKILQTHRRASRQEKAATPHTTWACLTLTYHPAVGWERMIGLDMSYDGAMIRVYDIRGKIEEGVGGQVASTSLHGCITGREQAICRA